MIFLLTFLALYLPLSAMKSIPNFSYPGIKNFSTSISGMAMEGRDSVYLNPAASFKKEISFKSSPAVFKDNHGSLKAINYIDLLLTSNNFSFGYSICGLIVGGEKKKEDGVISKENDRVIFEDYRSFFDKSYFFISFNNKFKTKLGNLTWGHGLRKIPSSAYSTNVDLKKVAIFRKEVREAADDTELSKALSDYFKDGKFSWKVTDGFVSMDENGNDKLKKLFESLEDVYKSWTNEDGEEVSKLEKLVLVADEIIKMLTKEELKKITESISKIPSLKKINNSLKDIDLKYLAYIRDIFPTFSIEEGLVLKNNLGSFTIVGSIDLTFIIHSNFIIPIPSLFKIKVGYGKRLKLSENMNLDLALELDNLFSNIIGGYTYPRELVLGFRLCSDSYRLMGGYRKNAFAIGVEKDWGPFEVCASTFIEPKFNARFYTLSIAYSR